MKPFGVDYLCSGDRTLQHKCKPKQNLESRGHPAQGRLNNALPCVCVGTGPCGILPKQLNRCLGSFSSRLSRKPALCNKSAETWAARLWAMLLLGHARTTQLTGHRLKENTQPSNQTRVEVFLSAFTFESGKPTVAQLTRGILPNRNARLSFGGCFLAFCFALSFYIRDLVRTYSEHNREYSP